MADTKISALTSGDPIADGDLLAIARGGANNSISFGGLLASVLAIAPIVDLPTGAKAQSLPRSLAVGAGGAPTSGQPRLNSIWLPKGTVITSITFVSGATALATGTHQQFGLYDSAVNLLGSTTDDTSTAWAANTAKTLSLTPGTFTTTYSGLHYVAVLIAATTVPSLIAAGALQTGVQSIAPLMSANATQTGLTALPSTLTMAAAGQNFKHYCYVS